MTIDRSQSKAMLERTAKVIPGGVASSLRALDTAFFVDRGNGSRIWDVDGNEYIDLVMAYAPLTLGHAPECVNDAIREQLDKGLVHGTGVALEAELAEELVEMVPGVEQVRFNMSGSEADHMALRLARAHTGKDKIVKFEGHFHGTIAECYLSVNPNAPFGPAHAPWTKRQVAGQLKSYEEDVIIQPFNELDVVRKTLKERGHEIAAVILEPVACFNGVQLPDPGFLEGLRQATEEAGVLLIFDEVVTGFRMALGGAQEYFGVIPDLTVMAKGLGCGVPIAALGGKKAVMETISNWTMPHYGTYNANALCLAGALAGLRELKKNGGTAVKHLNNMGRILREGFNELFVKYDAPLYAQGMDPVFTIVSKPERKDSHNYRDFLNYDYATARRFRDEMFDRGVWMLLRGSCVVSAAHTEDDIGQVLKIADKMLSEGDWKTRPLEQY